MPRCGGLRQNLVALFFFGREVCAAPSTCALGGQQLPAQPERLQCMQRWASVLGLCLFWCGQICPVCVLVAVRHQEELVKSVRAALKFLGPSNCYLSARICGSGSSVLLSPKLSPQSSRASHGPLKCFTPRWQFLGSVPCCLVQACHNPDRYMYVYIYMLES